MFNNIIKRRIFLVGCPRSGSTLLQSFMAAHPMIMSFPESHYFTHLFHPWNRLRELGFASSNGRAQFKEFIRILGRDEMMKRLPRTALLIRQYVDAFVGVLDDITIEKQKRIWVEKTPDHLRCAQVIEKYIPGSRFIHIVREGKDVVASLYEVSHRYPEYWDGPWTIERCIAAWNRALEETQRDLKRNNRMLVYYEQLVDQPEIVLRNVCNFLGVEFNHSMIENRESTAGNVILINEPWKKGVLGAVNNCTKSKFAILFDEQQQFYIKSKLESMGKLRKLTNEFSILQ